MSNSLTMPDLDHLDRSSHALARRGLVLTLSLAWAGAAVGVLAIFQGSVAGGEAVLVLCSLLFSTGAIASLIALRTIGLQTVATVVTVFFAGNLCAGVLIAVCGRGEHLNLFVYLIWFFPLMVFNKLVNKPSVGRRLAGFLMMAPLLLICALAVQMHRLFPAHVLSLIAAYCLAYLCFGLMLNIVTRYREGYILEQERAESLKLESELLESISDCFLSLDANSRLVYLNDAACAEFGVDRNEVLRAVFSDAVPIFFSKPMLAGMAMLSTNTPDTTFEIQNDERLKWYAMRCYPRSGGISVSFRNITESTVARRELEQAHGTLREQAELLDNAQDAIFVVNMDNRLSYWNKGAERIYGWTSEEVLGSRSRDIFQYNPAIFNERTAALLRDGKWAGEISQPHRDGHMLTVESHLTLVAGEDGKPRSILAINTDVTSRKKAEARIQHLAYYDTLTELPNRQLLQERISTALTATAVKESLGALLFVGLDDFKTINATLGHDKGDLMLKQLASRLSSRARPGDTVARFGGDEFVVMLEDLPKDAAMAAIEAKTVADNILAELIQPYSLESYESDSTASIGIILFPASAHTVDDLLKRAELSMYRAKARGANTTCFFDPDIETQMASRATLRSDLRRALQHNEFELRYQPQIDSEGTVVGAEALLRWRHPRRGTVSPAEFIPLAEEAGLIVEMGRWVLETACSQLAVWAASPEMEPITIAVNVSVRQFFDANFVSLVREALRTSGANPRRLKLEITESSVMEKVDDMIAKMTALNDEGVVFSLDDFGTGYSSLSHLKRLPLAQLKIDRSFVNDVLTNPKDASIARTIIALGRNLNLSVIAEGVETEEQRAFLESEGCDTYQGFLFSPAVSAIRFEEYVASELAA